jgi:hypothetical protein
MRAVLDEILDGVSDEWVNHAAEMLAEAVSGDGWIDVKLATCESAKDT